MAVPLELLVGVPIGVSLVFLAKFFMGNDGLTNKRWLLGALAAAAWAVCAGEAAGQLEVLAAGCLATFALLLRGSGADDQRNWGISVILLAWLALWGTYNVAEPAARAADGVQPLSTGQKACVGLFSWTWMIWAASHASATRLGLTAQGRSALDSWAEFGVIMLLMWVCDRTPLLARAKKHYDRDQYWFVSVCILAAALLTARRVKLRAPAPKLKAGGGTEEGEGDDGGEPFVPLLPREQTDEWRGWMQALTLLYHYFQNHEMYNMIRVFVSSYYWMTGFGPSGGARWRAIASAGVRSR